MSDDGKVLTGLVERRALEAAFRELGRSERLDLVLQRADEIATHGAAALPVLLSLLEGADPQMRGGLGQVAKRLDRTLVAPALRAVALSPKSSQPARISALTILERYLDEKVDESLLTHLQEPDDMAAQSLSELVSTMTQSPASLLEYLRQLAEQPDETLWMILRAVPGQMPNPHLVEFLRVLAQGENARVAQAAVEELGRTRMPEAAAALVSLQANLPAPLAALAERGARKLRMSGLTPPPSELVWRALLSPVDGQGVQLAWFIGQAAGAGDAQFLNVVMQDPFGIVICQAAPDVPLTDLPLAQEHGAIYPIRGGQNLPTMLMLEVSPDVARQVVRAGLALNWAAAHPIPPEYRLYNRWIWPAGALGGDDDASEVADVADDAQVATLLNHPAFATWLWLSDAVLEAAAQLRSAGHPPERRAEVITDLAAAQFTPEVIVSYRRRLTRNAQWLALGGQPDLAALARAAAAHLSADSALLRQLIANGLEVATLSAPRSVGGRPRLKRHAKYPISKP